MKLSRWAAIYYGLVASALLKREADLKAEHAAILAAIGGEHEATLAATVTALKREYEDFRLSVESKKARDVNQFLARLAKHTDYDHAVSFAGEHLRDNSVRASAYDLAPMLRAYSEAILQDVRELLER